MTENITKHKAAVEVVRLLKELQARADSIRLSVLRNDIQPSTVTDLEALLEQTKYVRHIIDGDG